MKSLFNRTDSEAIIDRIEKLQATSQPLWGKMNIAQMLAHCLVTFGPFFGTLKIKRSLVGILFGGIAKKKLLHEGAFSKNLPTAKEFIVADLREFEQEKEKLVSMIKKFTSTGDAHTVQQHPFFGKMSGNEWGILAYKHLDHHLQQFGA